MKQIQTVLGPISPNELGTTMMHEHLIWNQEIYQRPLDPNSEEGKFAYSKIVPENMYKIRLSGLHSHRQCAKQTDKEEASEELAYFKAAGGSAIVDCTCLGLDRDPLVEKYVSEKTGVHVIMATGVYSKGSCPEVETLSSKEKADLFIKELTEDVDGSGVRAGVIGEIGVSCFDEYEQSSLIGAARAQAETDAAILIHQPGLWKVGHEILDLIEDNGGNVERTVLCHCDPVCDDITYLERLMQRGVNLSFDQFGLEAFLGKNMGNIWLPRDYDRIRAIIRLCELGYSKQIVLSQDLCFQICYKKYGGGGYAHILENIIPIMQTHGIHENAINRMLVTNPARILAKQIK